MVVQNPGAAPVDHRAYILDMIEQLAEMSGKTGDQFLHNLLTSAAKSAREGYAGARGKAPRTRRT